MTIESNPGQSNQGQRNATLSTELIIKAAALLVVVLFATPVTFAQEAGAVKRPKIGIAFEGGGALGLGHVGVLEWMEKNHIPVDYIAGTSMGGLVGGLYATGSSPAEIRTLMRDIDWDKVLRGQIPFDDLAFRRKEDKRAYPNNIELGLHKGKVGMPGGLNSGQQVRFILDRAALPYSNLKSFDDLPIPFRCVATELGTGSAHVFRDGSLSDALRATMSLPAIFTPVTGKDGKVYVDGGLINNLPVDIVKAMGADIVIAIYLETSPFDTKVPLTMMTMAGRSVGLMIAANEKHNMEVADLLVTVDLAGYTAEDYNKGDKIADQGYAAAEKKAALLSRLAMDGPTWEQYLAKRGSRRLQAVPVPQFVEVSAANPQLASEVQKSLESNVGVAVDTAKLEPDLSRVAGIGRFSSLSYQMIQRDGKEGLLIRGEEKTFAPPTLQIAAVVDGTQYNDVKFAFSTRVTVLDLGGYRSEWRTDVTIGSTYALDSEYYHPFTPKSQWFVAPRVYGSSSSVDLFSRGERIAEYGLNQGGAALDFGRLFGRRSQIRAGYSLGYQSTTLRVGSPALPTGSGQRSASSVRYELNALDNPVIPRSGVYLTSGFRYIDHSPKAGGGFYSADLNGLVFHKVSKKGSVFIGAQGGSTFGHEGGVPEFFLGGGLRLGAYGRNEILTNQFFLFRAGYIHELGSLPPMLGDKIYALTYYEIGKAYGGNPPSRLPTDVNSGVVINTLIGPLFVAGAYGDTGHRKIYFQLGKVF